MGISLRERDGDGNTNDFFYKKETNTLFSCCKILSEEVIRINQYLQSSLFPDLFRMAVSRK